MGIEKQFMPYDLSLKMKGLGFDDICFFVYNFKNKLVQKSVTTPLEYCRNSNENFGGKCTAPLWQQVFDWFREKYNLHLEIRYLDDVAEYGYAITDILVNTEIMERYYLSYTEAREQLILKAIELCKNN